MVGFNSVQNSGKWLDFSVKRNRKTLIFATREGLIMFFSILSVTIRFVSNNMESVYVFVSEVKAVFPNQ